jgi:hypothetical protein
MKVNVGSADKVVRVVIGLVIIAIGVVYKSWWGAIGLVPLATVALGWCPLYAIIGVSTRKRATQPH